MKRICLSFMLLSVALCVKSRAIDTDAGRRSFKTGNDVLNYMHQKYKSGPCRSYTFSQKNKHYRNDSLVANSEWHESIEFPDKFRIDFGDKANGNFVIFKNDRLYRYRKSVLLSTSYNVNTLLLLLGGMYYRELSDVLQRLQKSNYNTDVLSSQKWNKQPVYVIGAIQGDTLSNQIWVEKKTLKVVRIIEKTEKGHMMDMTFDAHQEHCNGYIETNVTFRDNGKMEQVEAYYDIKAVDSFPEETFKPAGK